MLQLICLNSAYRYLGQVQIAFADILLFLPTNWSSFADLEKKSKLLASALSIEFHTQTKYFTRLQIQMLISNHDEVILFNQLQPIEIYHLRTFVPNWKVA